MAALPRLARADLEAVHGLCAHLLGATGAAQAGALGADLALYDALVTAIGASVPYSALPTDSARRLRNNVPSFIKFLDTNFVGWDHNKITKTAFLRMLFTLLVSDLKGRGVSPSVNIIIVNMGRMPEVFDNAFPGYLGAGLGHVILKQYARKD